MRREVATITELGDTMKGRDLRPAEMPAVSACRVGSRVDPLIVFTLRPLRLAPTPNGAVNVRCDDEATSQPHWRPSRHAADATASGRGPSQGLAGRLIIHLAPASGERTYDPGRGWAWQDGVGGFPSIGLGGGKMLGRSHRPVRKRA